MHVQTRMQAAQTISSSTSSSSNGLLDTARAMYAAEGAGVFYRGLSLKLARAVPMSVVGFFVYEEVAAALRDSSTSSNSSSNSSSTTA
jgi:Mitochondrial carrier protein